MIVGTLCKALGSYGAFVCCDAETRALLVNRARTLIYSTALPPASIGAALAALAISATSRERMAALHANARVLREALGVEVSDMPIVPLIIGEPEAALAPASARSSRGSSPRRSAHRRSPTAPRACASSPAPTTTRPTSAAAGAS